MKKKFTVLHLFLDLFIVVFISGFLYYTTIRTLTKVDCMLRAMFSGKLEVLTDAEGWILVDRYL